MSAPSADRRLEFAPWALVLLLLVVTVGVGAVVVEAVRQIADSFLAPAPLRTVEWVQGVIALTSQEFAFGVAAGAIATGTAGAVVVALVVAAVRRGARIAAGLWLIAPAVVGAVFVVAAVRLAQDDTASSSLDSADIAPYLLSSSDRAVPTLAVTLGWAGALLLAGVAGCVAVASRVALAGCVVVAVALTIGTVAAVRLAAAPVDAVVHAAAYPAQTIQLDPFPEAVGSILALGAAAFVVAALAAAALRARRRPNR